MSSLMSPALICGLKSDFNYIKLNVSRSYIFTLILESKTDVDCVSLNVSISYIWVLIQQAKSDANYVKSNVSRFLHLCLDS